jgi:putative Holliday junction resolvase
MGRFLAIDYGTKRTGIAVSDPGRMIASPLETVPTHELMHFLENYFRNEEVEILVVGLPRTAGGKDSASKRPLQFFIQSFRKRFPDMKVAWEDERYTSRMARKAMIEGGMKQKDRRQKGQVDKISASLILQSWMEGRNNPG